MKRLRQKSRDEFWNTVIATTFAMSMLYCVVFIVSCAWHDGAS